MWITLQDQNSSTEQIINLDQLQRITRRQSGDQTVTVSLEMSMRTVTWNTTPDEAAKFFKTLNVLQPGQSPLEWLAPATLRSTQAEKPEVQAPAPPEPETFQLRHIRGTRPMDLRTWALNQNPPIMFIGGIKEVERLAELVPGEYPSVGEVRAGIEKVEAETRARIETNRRNRGAK